MKSRRKPLTPIQKSAEGETCALRIPGVCSFDTTTVVLCHAPYPGRHGSRKDDFFAVYGCSECHDYMDMRMTSSVVAGMAGSRYGLWLSAIHETQAKLIAKGLMTIGAAA